MLKGRLVSAFSLPDVNVPRSTFNLSFSNVTAFDAGKLIPIYCQSVEPGDTRKVDTGIFARLAPCVAPVLDNLYLDTFWFFVPNRLVWHNWQKFFGEQENPGDSTDYLVPQVLIPSSGNGFAIESVFDYMGELPVLVNGDGTEGVDAQPFRAHNLIWNEWFRDENLQNSLTVKRDDGPDSPSLYGIYRRNKKKDYFTSATPLPQKGDGVSISLGSSANVYGVPNVPMRLRPYDNNDGIDVSVPGMDDYVTLSVLSSQGASANRVNLNVRQGGLNNNIATGGSLANNNEQYNLISKDWIDDNSSNLTSGLVADLAGVDPIAISTFRYALLLQKFRERQLRFGTRYIETLLGMFGVKSSNGLLQRPELLGASSSLMTFSPVAQTSSTDNTSPQGNLTSYGVLSSRNIGFRRSFEEHGWIIGYAQVHADQTYQQGIGRKWSRRRLTDYYFPLFNGLSEQAILNKELYYGGDAYDNEVFGYQERFSELRYQPNIITGKMRSIYSNSLDVYHFSQYWSNRPTLNSDFIEDRTDTVLNRVLAVQNEPQILMSAYFNDICTRVLPVHSIPGMGAHL